MIFTERTITVVNDSATINKPLILYRGDKNIELKITIAESQFKFRNTDASNVIETTDASYAQLVINTPYNSPIFSDVAATKNGAVIFVITEAMIDEIREVGAYEIQIRLLDDNKQSRASIPPVSNAIEIREPIAIEDGSAVDSNAVNVAKVNRALTTTSAPLEAFDSQGNYIKKTWGDGDPITDAALNKMETGIDGVNKKVGNVNSQIKDIKNKINKPNDNENNKIIPFNYIDSSGSSSTLFDASNAFNGNLAIHDTLGNGWINKTSNRWIRFTMPIGVVIGDSIAEGHKVTHGRLHLEDGSVNLDKPNEPGQISFHLELLSGIKFINHGIGGQRTDEILNRFNRDVLAKEDVNLTPSKTLEYKPNLIIVSAGVNDILQNKPYENIINNLKSMMEICVENKIYAIFNTIGYFNSITPTVEQIEKIDNVNNWLKLQCDKSKYIKCWDYNKFISSETQGFPNEDLLTDKIHPSKETYRRMSEEIYYTHLSSINFIPKYITISTQVSPNGLFSGLSRPLQIIINYDNSNYSYVYILHNKPIVNIPIPNEVAKPISEIKLTISTGQSPSEVENLTGGSSNFYISEIYGTNVNCDENIIASGIGYLFSNVPDGLSSGRIMISDSEYSKSDNLKLFGVTTGETINNKILIISGTCIMEASESLNENDFVITTTRGKIKKCTDFATENIIARVIRNAGTSNPLEYICEIIR